MVPPAPRAAVVVRDVAVGAHPVVDRDPRGEDGRLVRPARGRLDVRAALPRPHRGRVPPVPPARRPAAGCRGRGGLRRGRGGVAVGASAGRQPRAFHADGRCLEPGGAHRDAALVAGAAHLGVGDRARSLDGRRPRRGRDCRRASRSTSGSAGGRPGRLLAVPVLSVVGRVPDPGGPRPADVPARRRCAHVDDHRVGRDVVPRPGCLPGRRDGGRDDPSLGAARSGGVDGAVPADAGRGLGAPGHPDGAVRRDPGRPVVRGRRQRGAPRAHPVRTVCGSSGWWWSAARCCACWD